MVERSMVNKILSKRLDVLELTNRVELRKDREQIRNHCRTRAAAFI